MNTIKLNTPLPSYAHATLMTILVVGTKILATAFVIAALIGVI